MFVRYDWCSKHRFQFGRGGCLGDFGGDGGGGGSVGDTGCDGGDGRGSLLRASKSRPPCVGAHRLSRPVVINGDIVYFSWTL
jgi:hypothetical protein